MRVIHDGNAAVLEFADNVVTFEAVLPDRLEDRLINPNIDPTNGSWPDTPLEIGDYKVLKYGDDNQFPKELANTVFSNHLAPRAIEKRVELLWMQGPRLYKEEFEDNNLIRKWQDDNNEVAAWLKTWDYEDYLYRSAVDYHFSSGVFSKLIPTKAGRLGTPKVLRLEHSSLDDNRVGYLKSSTDKKVTHVLNGDWSPHTYKVKAYKLYKNIEDLVRNFAFVFSYSYSFIQKHYPLPDFIGAFEWMKRSTAVPRVLKSLTNNSLNIKWHITSPMAYWEDKEEKLRLQCTAKGITYEPQMLEDLKTEILKKLGEVLSGVENVGKFWHNEVVKEAIGDKIVEHGWTIVAIDQKVKDYITGQLEIAKRADYAATAGIGLHQSLSNIGGDGKSDSGSEQLYAMKNHSLSSVNIPERKVCEAVNIAIKINFPNSPYKMGFMNALPEREEDITPKNRITNAV